MHSLLSLIQVRSENKNLGSSKAVSTKILMAISKLVIVSLLISLLALHLVEAAGATFQEKGTVAQSSPFKKIDCGGKCDARCAKSSRPRLCKRACGTCCQRCNCVPPGTAGNKEVCPCYASLTTHGGRPKCP